MDFSSFIHLYDAFFDWQHVAEILSQPSTWGIILSLIIIEGLLSADNALVLAAIVKNLPEHQRKKALMYGIWGAYIFRFIAIGLGVYLVQFSAVKIIGGGYLIWLAVKYFWDAYKAKQKNEEDEEEDGYGGKFQNGIIYRIFGQFWGTIVVVEMMDIAFSIDSVLAAFAISEEVWVLLLGGLLGVLMMRQVAGLFLKLLDRIPELETAAFIVILFIGSKMVLSVFGIHLPQLVEGETGEHLTFFLVLFLIFGSTFARHFYMKKKSQS